MTREEMKTEIHGALLTQALGMDSDSLAEYYADHELEGMEDYTDEQLAETVAQLKGEPE